MRTALKMEEQSIHFFHIFLRQTCLLGTLIQIAGSKLLSFALNATSHLGNKRTVHRIVMQKNLISLKKAFAIRKGTIQSSQTTQHKQLEKPFFDWKRLFNTKTRCQYRLLCKAYDNGFRLIPWKPPLFEEILNIKVTAEINARNSGLYLSLSSLLNIGIGLNGRKQIIKAHCGLKARLEILAFKLSGFSLGVL